MSNTVNINQNNDVLITCFRCGASFGGQAKYSHEVVKMFDSHRCIGSDNGTKGNDLADERSGDEDGVQ